MWKFIDALIKKKKRKNKRYLKDIFFLLFYVIINYIKSGDIMIYLDYAANTPVDKKVLKVFNSATKKYIANPNSNHPLGLKAKNEIDKSLEVISKYFKTNKENVIITSGSSESNNLVIKGICERYKEKGKHIIISSIEHSSIVAPSNYLTTLGYEVTVLPLDKNGKVDLKELEKSIRKDTILVSITSVDSELGIVQPIEKIGKMLKEKGIVFHTDATQAIGKVNINFKDVDFITFAPHKFYGLNGVGVLINRNDIKITPLIHGGKSTTIYRSGTPMTANIIACSKALELATTNIDKRNKYIKKLKDYLLEELSKLDFVHINSTKDSIPSTLNFSLINKSSKEVVDFLYKKGICVSTQSACSLGTAPSKSVMALTNDKNLAENSIRISLSHLTKKKEINEFLKEFIEACK